MNTYATQKLVERQIANAVARRLLSRVDETTFGKIVDTAMKVNDFKTELRQLMDNVVNDLLH